MTRPVIAPGFAAAVACFVLLSGCENPPPPPVLATAVLAPAPKAQVDPRGIYTGNALLTGFRGDCNAGGTGWLKVEDGGAVSYADDRNGSLSGLLGSDGKVDLARDKVHLAGFIQDGRFKGKVWGGVCDYTYTFSQESPREKVALEVSE